MFFSIRFCICLPPCRNHSHLHMFVSSSLAKTIVSCVSPAAIVIVSCVYYSVLLCRSHSFNLACLLPFLFAEAIVSFMSSSFSYCNSHGSHNFLYVFCLLVCNSHTSCGLEDRIIGGLRRKYGESSANAWIKLTPPQTPPSPSTNFHLALDCGRFSVFFTCSF